MLMHVRVPSAHEAARSTQGTVSNRTPVPTDFPCSVQPVIIRRVLPDILRSAQSVILCSGKLIILHSIHSTASDSTQRPAR
jgi:hypothetical protein